MAEDLLRWARQREDGEIDYHGIAEGSAADELETAGLAVVEETSEPHAGRSGTIRAIPRRGLTRIHEFTADELKQALAIALREDNESEGMIVRREYRRRNVMIPRGLYWAARKKWQRFS